MQLRCLRLKKIVSTFAGGRLSFCPRIFLFARIAADADWI